MKRKGGTLTEAELKLWRDAMRDAEPLRAPASKPPEPPPAPPRPRPEPAVPLASPAPKPPDFAAFLAMAPRPKAGPSAAVAAAAPFVATLGPGAPGLDKHTARRLAKGEKRPEGKLDLHGMTLERAHAALIWFVLGARQSGKRVVLVVTGKGGDYQARALGLEGHRRGSLRESVPRWLGAPPLNGHVGGVYQAHERHGGAGALYVYLRKG